MTAADETPERVMAALRAHLPLTLLVDLVQVDGPGSEEIAAREREWSVCDLSSDNGRFGPAP